uniref:Uncharacterized protein n=1 Tax=viral metagenome TaxID=1070528 RepID=A0A6M3JZZ6_9ZZZZ
MSEPFYEKPLKSYRQPHPLFNQRLLWYRNKVWNEDEIPTRICYAPDPITRLIKERLARNKFAAFQF